MKKIYICFGIFLSLAVTRLIPHPPNFTSLIALSFYIPFLFGLKYLPILLVSFVITDLYIGFHETIFFTYFSVLFIGLFSNYFSKNLINRVLGSFLSAIIFFVITNFGFWTLGFYPYTILGLIECYFMALPFFSHTIISTLIYGILIEIVFKMYLKRKIIF